MNVPLNPDDYKTHVPTDEEQNLVAWGRENHKNRLATIQDSLRSLVTLSASLLAASVGLAGVLGKQGAGGLVFVALAAACFLAALASSLFGTLPIAERAHLWDVGELREARGRMEARKLLCTWVASTSILLGFVLGLVWMFDRLFGA